MDPRCDQSLLLSLRNTETVVVRHFKGGTIINKIWLPVLVAAIIPFLPTSSLSAAGAENSAVDICPGIDESKVEKVDILILLDNSRSLSSKKTGSDLERKRFDALRIFFASVSNGLKKDDSSGSRVEVDVSLMAFSQNTNPIDLKQDISKPEALANEISDALPDESQQPGTNFISALDAAATFMESKQIGSCKFLIWFTDGAFTYSDDSKKSLKENKAIEAEKLEELKVRTCDEKGWANRLRKSGVNTYVVLLGELNTLQKDNPESFPPSLALMTQITGDQSTEELGDIAFCEGEKPSVVGEIFTVGSNDIAKLTPVFEKIGLAVGGYHPVVCPITKESNLERLGLPDLKFFKAISLISLELEELPLLSEISVVTPMGERQASSDFFEEVKSDSASKLDLKPRKGQLLKAGWKFFLDAKPGFCIMAKFIDPPIVKFTKSGNNPAVVKSSDDVLSDEEVSRVSYQLGDKPITPDEVMLQFDKIDAGFMKGLTGQLEIEANPTEPIFQNPLTIIVTVDKVLPDVGPCLKPFVFKTERIPTSGDTPKDRNFLTGTCNVVTKNLPDGSKLEINIDFLVSELKSRPGCDAIGASLIVDGQTRGGKFDVPVNVVQAVALNFEVGEKDTLCNLQNFAGVQFVYGDGNKFQETASVTVDFDFKLPPDPWRVRIVTAVIVLLAILLSLMLLRYITSLLAVMPDKGKVYSYESLIEISVSSFGQVIVLINGEESSKFQPSGADLKLPKNKSTKSSMELQEIKLERKLGNFFRPFADPKAKVMNTDQVSYWQQASGGGLSIPFRKAIIVSKPKDNGLNTTKLTAQLTLIVSNTGADGGIEGVRTLIQSQQLKDVCKDYRDRYLSADKEKPVQPGPSPDNPKGGGGSAPSTTKPPRPRQPGPPPPSP